MVDNIKSTVSPYTQPATLNLASGVVVNCEYLCLSVGRSLRPPLTTEIVLSFFAEVIALQQFIR